MAETFKAKPDYFTGDGQNAVLAAQIYAKTAQAKEYKYEAGETRLRIELRGRPQKDADRYIRMYRDFCNSVFNDLNAQNISPKDEIKFITAISREFYSKFSMHYEVTALLSGFLDSYAKGKKKLDCDSC